MGTKHRLDSRKCLEVLVHVATELHDQHAILKAIYIADKEHIRRYGRSIYADRYRAMAYGPVASRAYDMIKTAAGKRTDESQEDIRAAIRVDGNDVSPLRNCRTKFLSASERECLEIAIGICGSLSFNERVDLTHDAAYVAAGRGGWITTDSIARTLPNSDAVLEYLHNG